MRGVVDPEEILDASASRFVPELADSRASWFTRFGEGVQIMDAGRDKVETEM